MGGPAGGLLVGRRRATGDPSRSVHGTLFTSAQRCVTRRRQPGPRPTVCRRRPRATLARSRTMATTSGCASGSQPSNSSVIESRRAVGEPLDGVIPAAGEDELVSFRARDPLDHSLLTPASRRPRSAGSGRRSAGRRGPPPSCPDCRPGGREASWLGAGGRARPARPASRRAPGGSHGRPPARGCAAPRRGRSAARGGRGSRPARRSGLTSAARSRAGSSSAGRRRRRWAPR